MKKTINILILLTLFGCTPQQRLNKLLNRHPYLAKKDTIHFIDTVQFITNKVEVDTVTKLDHLRRDTFVLEREHLKIKTIVHKDSIYIWGQCDKDTVYTVIEKHIPYDKFEYQELNKFKKYFWMLLVFIVIIIVALILWNNVIKKWIR